ncbi:MAG: phytanoyl-CoA dioxygenase family protein [Pseudomonadota bacterium]
MRLLPWDMLSIVQLQEFDVRGYTRVQDAVDPDALERVREQLWCELAPFGLERDRPESFRRARPKGLQTTANDDRYDALFDEEVCACVDTLLGARRWHAPAHWGQLLLSLPVDQRWTIPSQAWHLDLPAQIPDSKRPGVQLFICVEDIQPRCGATVVASGTQQLVQSVLQAEGLPAKHGSATLRRRIANESEWFAQLLRKERVGPWRDEAFLEPHLEAGIELGVDELTGTAGDLILMHPYLFHAPAANAGPALRIALTQRIYAVA